MSIDTYDCEPCQIYRESKPTARKKHRCNACHEWIQPGASYVRIFMVCDGDATECKRCARCQKIYEHLMTLCATNDLTVDMWLDCGETYQDEWGCDPPPEIAALAFALPGEVTA